MDLSINPQKKIAKQFGDFEIYLFETFATKVQSRKFSRLHLLGKYTYIRGIALIQWVCIKCLLLNFLGKKEVKWVLLLFSKHCYTKAVFRSKTRSENLPNPIARLSSSLHKELSWTIRRKFNEKTLNCFDHILKL